jgi:hypothetical protein
MKFLQTSRGCRITFEEGDEFAGKQLSCDGERYSKGFYLASNIMQWISQDNNGKTVSENVSEDIKNKLMSIIIDGGKKQGIIIAFHEVKGNV